VTDPATQRIVPVPRDRRTHLIPWAVAAVLAIMLAITTWRTVDLGNELDDARAERDAIAAQLLDAQVQAGATAYRLNATPDGPANASGTAFMPDSGSGVLAVVNLPAAPAGNTWQLWYISDQNAPPVPGPTFATDANGMGYSLIPADVGAFGTIAISLEPAAGSAIPTTPMVLQGTATQGARG
jgi:hypothetical protein